MDSKLKFRIFSIISIILLCIGVTYKTFQNDTFYIIKLGEFISNHGIDSKDHYCWVADLSYTYPHWLYDLLIYHIYDFFGYLGVYISVIVCFIFLTLCMYFVSLKLIQNEFGAFFISIITIFSVYIFAVARAQIISLSFFLLEVYCLNKLRETGKNKYIYYLCLFSLLIANIHATAWLFYFVLFLPFIGEELVYKLSKNKKIRKLYKLDNYKDGKIIVEEISNIKKILIGMFFSFLMGIFTPSRICYVYVFKIMMGNSQKVLLEHLPLVVIENPLFLALVFVFVVVLMNSKVKVYLRELFMICGLLLMSLLSARHLAFFYTIGTLYIIIISLRCLQNIGDRTFDILGNLLIFNKYICLFTMILIIGYSGYHFFEHSKEDYVAKKEYPVEAVKYIKTKLDYKNIRLYNDYNYGSYLLFNDIPVFIDSRCDLYLKEFNGMNYSIFDELEDIEIKYEKQFKKYDVTHVLIPKNDSLDLIISKDENYKKIYKDKNFVLYERLR